MHCELNKNNLMLFGLPEDASESVENCVYQLFRTKLSLQPEIDIAYRIGSANENNCADKPRPVKIKFVRVRDRNEVWNARVNLEKPFYINQDLHFEVRQKRKVLLQSRADALKEGKDAKFIWKRNQIAINDLFYEVNDGELKTVDNRSLTRGPKATMQVDPATELFLERGARGRRGKKPGAQ